MDDYQELEVEAEKSLNPEAAIALYYQMNGMCIDLLFANWTYRWSEQLKLSA